jgi:hypothetical protein
MSKPDWGSAPKWAKYVACDRDGVWRWHRLKPRLCWRSWSSGGDQSEPTGVISRNFDGWNASMEKRP